MDLEMKSFLEGFEQRMNVRFDAMDARFDGVDSRLNAMDVRFDGIDKRLDYLERNQNDMQEQIAYLVGSFGKFADDMRKLVHSHDVRITNLESRVQFV